MVYLILISLLLMSGLAYWSHCRFKSLDELNRRILLCTLSYLESAIDNAPKEFKEMIEQRKKHANT